LGAFQAKKKKVKKKLNLKSCMVSTPRKIKFSESCEKILYGPPRFFAKKSQKYFSEGCHTTIGSVPFSEKGFGMSIDNVKIDSENLSLQINIFL